MKRLLFGLVAAAALVAFVPATALAGGGKDVFLANKCNKCHAVKAQGIDLLKPKKNDHDLSKVGANHDAKWIEGWLKREVTKKKGDKEVHHKKKWKGSDGDLATLVKWLAGLK